MTLSIKVKFENTEKIYDLKLVESDSVSLLNLQQREFLEEVATDYETIETRIMCHLYNPETNMFLINSQEIKSSKNIKF